MNPAEPAFVNTSTANLKGSFNANWLLESSGCTDHRSAEYQHTSTKYILLYLHILPSVLRKSSSIFIFSSSRAALTSLSSMQAVSKARPTSKLFTPGCDGGQVAKNAKRELQFSNTLNFRCWVPASLTPTTKSTSTKHWQYRFSTALQLWPKLLLLASLNRGLLVGWRLWTTGNFHDQPMPYLGQSPQQVVFKET